MTLMDENLARRILLAAVHENRCAALLECLFEGGGATISPFSGSLLLTPGAAYKQAPQAQED